MRSGVAFCLITAASGRPSFFFIVSVARAHPVYFIRDSGGWSDEPPLTKRNTPTPHIAPPAPFLTPTIAISLVAFLLFSAVIISIMFFGSEIRDFFRQNMKQLLRRRPGWTIEMATDLGSPKPSFGFGFDGLAEAQWEVMRVNERRPAKSKLFIRIPINPPCLELKHLSDSPLSPINIEGPKGVWEFSAEEACPLMAKTLSTSHNDSETAVENVLSFGELDLSSSSSTTTSSPKSRLSPLLPRLSSETEHEKPVEIPGGFPAAA